MYSYESSGDLSSKTLMRTVTVSRGFVTLPMNIYLPHAEIGSSVLAHRTHRGGWLAIIMKSAVVVVAVYLLSYSMLAAPREYFGLGPDGIVLALRVPFVTGSSRPNPIPWRVAVMCDRLVRPQYWYCLPLVDCEQLRASRVLETPLWAIYDAERMYYAVRVTKGVDAGKLLEDSWLLEDLRSHGSYKGYYKGIELIEHAWWR